MRKTQTSTEYLMLLAVVVVIALIVVGVLGGIPSIGGGASKSASKAAWATQPVAVTNWVVDTIGTRIKIKNNLQNTIVLDSIILDNSEVSIGSTVAAGQTIDVYHLGKYALTETDYDYSLVINYTDLSSKARYLQNGSDLSLVGKSSLSSANLNAPILQDLVGWWRFDEDLSDYSGNGNHGVASAQAAVVQNATVQHGSGSLALDGTGDLVTVATIDEFVALQNYTWLGWAEATP
jgi:uncharacterized protein (UPF0333 family)